MTVRVERVGEVTTVVLSRPDVRNAVELAELTVRPKSPLLPVVASVATVTAAPKVAPWSVDLRIMIFSGEPLLK